MNFLEDCDAPPIRKPSISEIGENNLIFLALTEPPYKTVGDFLVFKIFLNLF